MDDRSLTSQVEILLGNAGYATWPQLGGTQPVICFEDSTVAGFVHVFANSDALIAGWEIAQNSVLARNAAALRGAGDKAWNIYTVLLTAAPASKEQAALLDAIEENFEATRKIACAGIATPTDVIAALQPLLPIQSQSHIGATDYEARLRAGLSEMPPGTITALLGSASIVELLQIVAEGSR